MTAPREESKRNTDLARSLDLRPLNLATHRRILQRRQSAKSAACAMLATNPRVLILDEPTLGVDIGAAQGSIASSGGSPTRVGES